MNFSIELVASAGNRLMNDALVPLAISAIKRRDADLARSLAVRYRKDF